MSARSPWIPDWDVTVRFLDALGIAKDESIYFRTIDEARSGRARNYQGTISEVWPRLAADNAAGYGVFFVVNAGGHTKARISKVRAVFADCDGGLHWSNCLNPAFLPHAIVQTSRGKWHAYWRVSGVSTNAFEDLQTQIAERFSTDRSVKDLSRVMRLPGFYHRKGEPQLVTVPFWRDQSYRPIEAEQVFASVYEGSESEGIAIKAGSRNTRLTALAGRLRRSGATFEQIRAALEATPTDPPLPAREIASIAKSVARYEPAVTLQRKGDVWQDVELSDLQIATLEPPQFVIDGVLPRRVVTVLGGHGGAGKSNLALSLATHVATGTSWGGLGVRQGTAVFVSLEDPGDVVKYRLKKVVESGGFDIDAVVRNLRLLDGSGDPLLMTEVSETGLKRLVATPAFEHLECINQDVDLLVVDNSSEAFDGDENNRRQVRCFMRRLSELSKKLNCGVLLLAHIDKAAAKHGAGGNNYSGSTAWHNSARSRLALMSGDVSSARLVQEKSNYGACVSPLNLEWEDGVLVPRAVPALTETSVGQEAAVLSLLAQAAKADVLVPVGQAGPRTAWEALDVFDDLRSAFGSGRDAKRRLFAVLIRLQIEGKVRREQARNQQRKMVERWALA